MPNGIKRDKPLLYVKSGFAADTSKRSTWTQVLLLPGSRYDTQNVVCLSTTRPCGVLMSGSVSVLVTVIPVYCKMFPGPALFAIA